VPAGKAQNIDLVPAETGILACPRRVGAGEIWFQEDDVHGHGLLIADLTTIRVIANAGKVRHSGSPYLIVFCLKRNTIITASIRSIQPYTQS
jgi:hypothetical protein